MRTATRTRLWWSAFLMDTTTRLRLRSLQAKLSARLPLRHARLRLLIGLRSMPTATAPRLLAKTLLQSPLIVLEICTWYGPRHRLTPLLVWLAAQARFI